MGLQTCTREADLRLELGRLRHERHEIDHELQALEAQLSILKTQKHQNIQQMRAVEKQLAHSPCQAEEAEANAEAGGAVARVLPASALFSDSWLLALLVVGAAAGLVLMGWLPS